MSKLINSLEMIALLEDRGQMKIKELAEELGVKDRMIRKYKDELVEAGIEIESVAGANGGYSLLNPVLIRDNVYCLNDEEVKEIVELIRNSDINMKHTLLRKLVKRKKYE